jgi:hypothetical protein
MGYAFCRAHSTAYGVEAYEAAHLRRYYPAEFLSCMLTHGKGFYSRLVYSLECRRLGIGFLLPDVNLSSDAYFPEQGSIRVPLCQISGITAITLERWRAGKPFASLRDFYLRVRHRRTKWTISSASVRSTPSENLARHSFGSSGNWHNGRMSRVKECCSAGKNPPFLLFRCRSLIFHGSAGASPSRFALLSGPMPEQMARSSGPD